MQEVYSDEFRSDAEHGKILKDTRYIRDDARRLRSIIDTDLELFFRYDANSNIRIIEIPKLRHPDTLIEMERLARIYTLRFRII